jgi:hypothetical protein
VSKDFFGRREFTFTMEGDVYIRYLNFRDQAALAKAIQAKQPHKIDIGAVFNAAPSKHNAVKKGVFKPVERELVFDIDLTDYDDIRTCCSGAKICDRCWRFMTVAMKVMNEGLRRESSEAFAFSSTLTKTSCSLLSSLVSSSTHTLLISNMGVLSSSVCSFIVPLSPTPLSCIPAFFLRGLWV